MADHEDSSLVKINDSTLIFKNNIKEPDYLLIAVNLDSKPKWYTRIWIDPREKDAELTIDYAKKTAISKNPGKWDSLTRITSEMEYAGKYKEELALIIPYIKSHPKSFLSLWYITHSHALYLKGTKTKQALFDKLNPSLSKYPLYDKTRLSLMPRHRPKAGDAFKEFKLGDKNGNIFNSDLLQNKWIVLLFWANNCATCIKEMDSLVNIYQSTDSSKIAFISISLDHDVNAWKRSKAGNKIQWPSVWQPNGYDGELCLEYNLLSLPFVVLFDPLKKFVLASDGPSQSENLKRLLLLAK